MSERPYRAPTTFAIAIGVYVGLARHARVTLAERVDAAAARRYGIGH